MNEKTTAEFEIKVPGEEDVFVKVPASELRLDDDFMKYEPKTKREQKFKEQVEKAIKSGLKDFYRPKYDPSCSEDGTSICYAPGKKPAVGKSYNWWEKVAKEFCPERNSRLGTKYEYIAFVAVLIKKLVASGWSVTYAWNSVCNDSKELGHYWNSKNAKCAFETTGSREICGFYDLANTGKILAEDEEIIGFWIAGAHYHCFSESYPLASLGHVYGCSNEGHFCCGWLVFDSCPDC